MKLMEFRENPVHDKRVPWILGLAAAGAALGGGFWFYEKWKGASVTVSPGANSVTVASGGKLTINLPSGSTWQGQLNVAALGGVSGTMTGGTGSSPAVISGITGGGSIGLSWTDASGMLQAGTLQVTVS